VLCFAEDLAIKTSRWKESDVRAAYVENLLVSRCNPLSSQTKTFLRGKNQVLGRGYEIKMVRSGVVLVCRYCSHRVFTAEFLSCYVGNRRTQAATNMNRHIEETHQSERLVERRIVALEANAMGASAR